MSEQQWYMTRRGHQIGPVPQSEIEAMMRAGGADGDTYVFTAGMTEWLRLKEVGAFQPLLAGVGSGPIPAPPGKTAHEIDFRIEGGEMQFVEVELDPGESAIAEAGTLMYMTDAIRMETIFGDGSERQSGIIGSLLGAGKRLLTGESLPSVAYDVQFVGGIKTALFGGEGLFFATLTGPGKVWLQSLPLSRLADRIHAAAPQTGGRRRGEGSVLDNLGIGDLVDGK